MFLPCFTAKFIHNSQNITMRIRYSSQAVVIQTKYL